MKPYNSLLLLVTLTIISVGGLFSIIGFVVIQREARQQIAELAEAQALGFSQMLAGTVEGALRNGQPLEARSQVMRMSLSPLVRSAYLVDNKFTIIYSTELNEVGSRFAVAKIPDINANFGQLQRAGGPFTFINRETDSIWVAVPVRLPPRQGRLISSEIGLLLAAYDYTVWDMVAQDYSLRNVVATIGLITAVSVVLLGLRIERQSMVDEKKPDRVPLGASIAQIQSDLEDLSDEAVVDLMRKVQDRSSSSVN